MTADGSPGFPGHDEHSQAIEQMRAADTETAAQDQLLACLHHLAARFDRPFSASDATAGLPLENGRLTPSVFVRAAERIGLASKVVRRSLSDLRPHELPAIILLSDRGYAVLDKLERRRAVIIMPDLGQGVETLKRRQLERDYSGYAILVKPVYRNRQIAASAPPRASHWFWSALAPLWPSYLQVVLAAAIVNTLALAAPLFIMNVYDRVLPNKAITTLWVLAIGIGAAILFDFIFRSLRQAILENAGRRADVRLASRLFEHIMSLDGPARPRRTGEFAQKIRDYELVREFFASSTVVTLTDFAFIWVFVAIIYAIAGPIAFVPVGALALVIVVGLFTRLRLARAVEASQAEAAHRNSILFEALGGLETIKCCRAEGQMQKQWEDFIAQNAKTSERMRSISTFGLNFTTFVQQLVTVCIVVMGVYGFSSGDITPGALIAAVILAGRAVAPLGQIANTLVRSQQALHSLRTLNGVISLPTEGHGQPGFIDKPIRSGSLAFENLSFTYPEASRPALDGVTLRVAAGERIGIIGRVGSGKTTFGRLIARLYAPGEGALMIDGVDIRQYPPSEIRRQLAFVSQDSSLFSGSVRDNIALGAPAISDEAVVRAAEIAGVAAFVNAHPHGYNLQVGEGGRALSSGQRHAVALARAFLHQPLILMLDEPTGSMDTASERLFVERVAEALRTDQTLLIATHRHAPLSLVDRLLVLDQGRLVADGPKDDILARLTGK